MADTNRTISVWGWGNNEGDPLGLKSPSTYDGGCPGGTASACLGPVRVRGLKNAVQVSAGWVFSLAVDNAGHVWMAGDNGYGTAGAGSVSSGGCQCIPRFQRVPGLSHIVAVSAGFYEAAALQSDGTVWTWGDNGSAQLGLGYVSSVGYQCVPRPTGCLTLATSALLRPPTA